MRRFALVVGALACTLAMHARAAVVAGVLHAQVVVPVDVASVRVALERAVNLSTAYLDFTYRHDEGSPTHGQLLGRFENASALEFVRAGSGASTTLIVEYNVIEFASGVVVRHADAVPSSSASVALDAAVDRAHAWPSLSARKPGSQWGSDDYARATLPTASSVRCSTLGSDGVCSIDVVEALDGSARVTYYEVTLAAHQADVYVALDAPVVVNSARVLLTHSISASSTVARMSLHGMLANATHVHLERGEVSSLVMTASLYVIEYTDATRVQRGDAVFVDAQVIDVVALATPVDRRRAYVRNTHDLDRGAMTNYTSENDIGATYATLVLSDCDDASDTCASVTAERRAAHVQANAAATICFEVIEYSDATFLGWPLVGDGRAPDVNCTCVDDARNPKADPNCDRYERIQSFALAGASTAHYVFTGLVDPTSVSHFHLAVPDCVDANAVTATDCTGAPLAVGINDYSSICALEDYPSLSNATTTIKIDVDSELCALAWVTVTMPGGVAGGGTGVCFAGIKASTECTECPIEAIGFGCATLEPTFEPTLAPSAEPSAEPTQEQSAAPTSPPPSVAPTPAPTGTNGSCCATCVGAPPNNDDAHASLFPVASEHECWAYAIETYGALECAAVYVAYDATASAPDERCPATPCDAGAAPSSVCTALGGTCAAPDACPVATTRAYEDACTANPRVTPTCACECCAPCAALVCPVVAASNTTCAYRGPCERATPNATYGVCSTARAKACRADADCACMCVDDAERAYACDLPPLVPTPPPPTTSAPTPSPTHVPTSSPTHAPTPNPTHAPTLSPTHAPTPSPTHAPTLSPTHAPTPSPTHAPTLSPTHAPTLRPTHAPTLHPTATPTVAPTHAPTAHPTHAPSPSPTHAPRTCEKALGMRLRSFGSTGGQELYLGVGDLGVGANRVAADKQWALPSTYNFTFVYTTFDDTMWLAVTGSDVLEYTNVAAALAARTACRTDSPLSVAFIEVYARDAGVRVEMTRFLQKPPFPGLSLPPIAAPEGGGVVVQIDPTRNYSAGFVIEGSLYLEGAFPTGSGEENSRFEIKVCCEQRATPAPTAPPTDAPTAPPPTRAPTASPTPAPAPTCAALACPLVDDEASDAKCRDRGPCLVNTRGGRCAGAGGTRCSSDADCECMCVAAKNSRGHACEVPPPPKSDDTESERSSDIDASAAPIGVAAAYASLALDADARDVDVDDDYSVDYSYYYSDDDDDSSSSSSSSITRLTDASDAYETYYLCRVLPRLLGERCGDARDAPCRTHSASSACVRAGCCALANVPRHQPDDEWSD